MDVSLIELFIIAVGLSMDAFAVSVCKGLSVRKAVNNFNAKKHRPYALTFSMGTTVFQGERQSLDDFLRNMDAAMYQSKRGRSHAEVMAGMEHGNACSYGCNGDF